MHWLYFHGDLYVGFVCFVPSTAKCFFCFEIRYVCKLLLNVIDVYFCAYRVRLIVEYFYSVRCTIVQKRENSVLEQKQMYNPMQHL